MKNKILILIAALFIGGFAFLSYSKKIAQPIMEDAQPEVAAIEESQPNQVKRVDELPKIELLAESDGQTAYELLELNHELEVKEYDFGVFIEGIDGIKGNDQYYWAFYLNGDYAEQGADQTVLKVGDKVEFRYEEVQF
jgi:Domain of unknown function (DUF4430)